MRFEPFKPCRLWSYLESRCGINNRTGKLAGGTKGNNERTPLVRIPIAVLAVSVEDPPTHEAPAAVLAQVDEDRSMLIDWNLSNEGVEGERRVR
jgi:hypothetical protein